MRCDSSLPTAETEYANMVDEDGFRMYEEWERNNMACHRSNLLFKLFRRTRVLVLREVNYRNLFSSAGKKKEGRTAETKQYGQSFEQRIF